ncbi:MAG: DNA translocase FtsK 4TM domain-containing protein, partial [Ginsengibacter sp.]
MATTKKRKKSKPAATTKMTPDKIEKVDVKKLIHDERSHKIAGSVLILISFLLFVAFTSYLFTWQQDQSKVLQGAKILLPGYEHELSNALGSSGAYFSDLFFRSGFGVASYLFCLFFFVVGVNLFAPKKIFSVKRNIRYVLAGLIVISVCASFLMHTPFSAGKASSTSAEFFWGGRVGDMINEWLQHLIGYVGTAALLLISLLSYIIWRFNPSFNFSAKKMIPAGMFSSGEDEEEKNENEPFLKVTPGILPINQIPKKEDAFGHKFEITEREEEEEEVAKKVSVIKPAPEKPATIIAQSSGGSMPLVVKNADALAGEEIEEEVSKPLTAAEKIRQDPYDPILDLRNYKYPSID